MSHYSNTFRVQIHLAVFLSCFEIYLLCCCSLVLNKTYNDLYPLSILTGSKSKKSLQFIRRLLPLSFISPRYDSLVEKNNPVDVRALWERIRLQWEWKETLKGNGNCICGASICSLFVINNTETKKQACVGSTCIEHFDRGQHYQLFASAFSPNLATNCHLCAKAILADSTSFIDPRINKVKTFIHKQRDGYIQKTQLLNILCAECIPDTKCARCESNFYAIKRTEDEKFVINVDIRLCQICDGVRLIRKRGRDKKSSRRSKCLQCGTSISSKFTLCYPCFLSKR